MADYSDPLGLLFGGVDYFGSPQQGKGLLQLTPQEIERMASAQSPAFGVFPQMQPYRSQQDITASANVPVDVARGRVAGTLGLFGDVFNQPIPMVRPLQLLSQAMTGQQKYPDTEYFLDTLPLKSDTPVGDVAGRIGSFAPINPMPAVRGVQKLGGLLGEEMATRLNTGRPILPSLLAEPQTTMFAVNPAEQAATSGLLQAEVSPLGFYSAVEQQALKIPRKQGTGESFLNDLLKGQDVKKYEIEAMGLDTYLKGKPNVTRQEVQDFIANNRVDVQERVLSGTGDKSRVFSEFNPAIEKYAVYGPDLSFHGTFNTAQEAEKFVNNYNAQIPFGPTTYDKYQLAGGENYRELVLTLPENMSEYNKYVKTLRDKYGQGGFDNLPLTDIERARLDKFYAAEELDPYKSSHFPDIANPLAHMRVNDRIDAEGKKMLLIEEVQSDWHQAGREKGYKSQTRSIQQIDKDLDSVVNELRSKPNVNYSPAEEDWARYPEITSKYEALSAERNLASKQNLDAVPDAPFKDTWYQLALKRAIKEAVDKGYDRIGLTTGKRQIERYTDELRQNVSEINFQTGAKLTPAESAELKGLRQQQTYMTGTERQRYEYLYGQEGAPVNQDETLITAFNGSRPAFTGKVKNGKFIEGPDKALGKTVEEVLGKSIAKQIEEKKTGSLTGDNLTIGGEGMKKYYDEVYPNYLEKYGKKYGAKVGETKVNTVKERAENSMIPSMGQETVRYLDITPEMRKAVQKGQPLAAVEGMTGLLA